MVIVTETHLHCEKNGNNKDAGRIAISPGHLEEERSLLHHMSIHLLQRGNTAIRISDLTKRPFNNLLECNSNSDCFSDYCRPNCASVNVRIIAFYYKAFI